MATSSTKRASSGDSGFSVCLSRGGRGRGDRGMPCFCRCGEVSVIKTSGIVKNPGRLFHCCPRGSENDKLHLFKWTDESMVEEIEDLKEIVGTFDFSSFEKEIEELKKVVNGYEKEIEELKKVMEAMKFEVLGCKKEVNEIGGDVRFMKRLIGCGVVVIASYWFFWA